MGYNYLIELKTLWEKKKLLVKSNFFFSHNVFKSCLLLMLQNEYLWSKGLKIGMGFKSLKSWFINVYFRDITEFIFKYYGIHVLLTMETRQGRKYSHICE